MKRLLQASCNATYMTTDLDEAMSKFDSYTGLSLESKALQPDGKDDFDRHDWEAEIQAMPKHQRLNLAISPFNWLKADGSRWKWNF